MLPARSAATRWNTLLPSPRVMLWMAPKLAPSSVRAFRFHAPPSRSDQATTGLPAATATIGLKTSAGFSVTVSRWDQRHTVTEKPAEVFSPMVAVAAGKPVVAWSEREGGAWNLKARTLEGASFGAIQSITRGEGSNVFHRVAADRAGNIHVVYQSWRKGRSDVYLRSQMGGRWQPEVN